jgi:hypothetical protein
MEKETAKIPGSLLARRWQHSDRSNQLVVRSKQPPDARARLRTSTDGRRFFNVTDRDRHSPIYPGLGRDVYFALKFRYRPGDETDGVPISDN